MVKSELCELGTSVLRVSRCLREALLKRELDRFRANEDTDDDNDEAAEVWKEDKSDAKLATSIGVPNAIDDAAYTEDYSNSSSLLSLWKKIRPGLFVVTAAAAVVLLLPFTLFNCFDGYKKELTTELVFETSGKVVELSALGISDEPVSSSSLCSS